MDVGGLRHLLVGACSKETDGPLMSVERPPVFPALIEEAIKELKWALEKQIRQYGSGCWVSPHEMLGQLQEEFLEFSQAVHADMPRAQRKELIDIAVAAIFSVASIDTLGPNKEL